MRKKERYAYALLSRKTGVPSSTIRNWCAGVDQSSKWDTLIASNERKREALRRSEAHVADRVRAAGKDEAKLMASLLYWCEGSKYPSSTAVTMVNSDPELMRTFVRLLRSAYDLDESKFHVHVQIHTTHDFEAIRKYWSTLLNISPAQFMKPTVTRPNGKKHRGMYMGTCTVKYQDYRILLKLMGIYEAFAKNIVNANN